MNNKVVSNVISRIVCWKCSKGGNRGDAPLKKISKTNYVCLRCLQWGAPTEENMSAIDEMRGEE